MNLMTERNQVRTVAERYSASYPCAYVFWDKRTAGELLAKLQALDPETATASDVEAIIGNASWVRPKECAECQVVGWDAVELGDPDRGESVYLCPACLQVAISLTAADSQGDPAPRCASSQSA